MKKAIAIILCLVLAMAITLPAAAITSVPVKSISLNSSTISLDVGKTYILKATLTPANTTQKALTYATSNKNVATVDAKGTITAVGKGTATITVLTANKDVSAKCSVTVGGSTKPVTLSIAHLWGGTDPKAAVFQAVWKQFQKDNPNVTLKVDELPSDGYADKENTWAATGTCPDVVLSDVAQQAKKFVDAGVAMDLTPFLKADKAWYDSFVPGIFDTGDARYNGKIYFIPNEYYNFPLWNDKVVMQKLGIAAPPVTWTDFMNDMVLAKAKGLYGLYLPNKGQNFGPTIFAIIAGASGQTTINAWNKALNGGKFSDPLVIEIFKKYQALAPYVTPDANANDGTIADQDYYHHKYLFMFRGPWQIQKCNTRAPEGAAFENDLIFSSVPYIAPSSKGFTPTGVGMEWMLSAKLNKDQTDAAVKLLKYITSPEVTLNYLYTAKESNGIKTEAVDPAKVGPGLTQCFNLLNSLPAGLKNPPSAYAAYYTTDASNQSYIVSQELIDNRITPAQAAKEMDDANASVN